MKLHFTFFLILVSNTIFCQINNYTFPNSNTKQKIIFNTFPKNILLKQNISFQVFNNKKEKKISDILSQNSIPKNFVVQHFGFMCTKELQLEKATKIPFRFRLGSLDYCNKLEGK